MPDKYRVVVFATGQVLENIIEQFRQDSGFSGFEVESNVCRSTYQPGFLLSWVDTAAMTIMISMAVNKIAASFPPEIEGRFDRVRVVPEQDYIIFALTGGNDRTTAAASAIVRAGLAVIGGEGDLSDGRRMLIHVISEARMSKEQKLEIINAWFRDHGYPDVVAQLIPEE